MSEDQRLKPGRRRRQVYSVYVQSHGLRNTATFNRVPGISSLPLLALSSLRSSLAGSETVEVVRSNKLNF